MGDEGSQAEGDDEAEGAVNHSRLGASEATEADHGDEEGLNETEDGEEVFGEHGQLSKVEE